MTEFKSENPRNVTVLLGGFSAEREISLLSGKACGEALERCGHTVNYVDMPRDLAELEKALTPRPDVVFNALHGRWGEDGTVQGMLDLLGIAYTHSGRVASTIAMDKPIANALFKSAGIPVPDGIRIEADDLAHSMAEGEDPMPRPYVIKPASEGSSVGVYIVEHGTKGPDLSGWALGDALVEEFIPGRELTVAVMGDKALGVTELRPNEGFYDYEAKYTDGKTTHLCPAPLPREIQNKCMELAVAAHRVLGCRGVSRADFRYDDIHSDGRIAMLEINTQPGMTPLSLVPEQADFAGISFDELVDWMVENATCDA